jgi:hypothetical protein
MGKQRRDKPRFLLARLGMNLRTTGLYWEEGPSVREEQEGRGLFALSEWKLCSHDRTALCCRHSSFRRRFGRYNHLSCRMVQYGTNGEQS